VAAGQEPHSRHRGGVISKGDVTESAGQLEQLDLLWYWYWYWYWLWFDLCKKKVVVN